MKDEDKPPEFGSGGPLHPKNQEGGEILLVLKNGGDVSAFEKALDQAVGEKANVKFLVSKRTLEVRDLDETTTREEVVAAPSI